MNQRAYDMALEATLTSLILEDRVQPYGAEFKHLIDTSSASQQTEFIRVEYKSAQKVIFVSNINLCEVVTSLCRR
jgi:hypothetical protein